MTSHDTIPALAVLPQIFHKLTDPRDPRGVRHPFAALCSLVFMGMLAQIVEMAVLVRWTKAHWTILREPLGFEREEVSSATCISRTLAGLSLKEFRQHFAEWRLWWNIDDAMYLREVLGLADEKESGVRIQE
jgi:hypothetical protein